MIIELITALSIPVACAVGGHNIAKDIIEILRS